jgi:type 1 glutamine amidotransferase
MISLAHAACDRFIKETTVSRHAADHTTNKSSHAMKYLILPLLVAAISLLPCAAPAAAPPLRVLVVTGGHSYPTSFYTVFENHADFRWDHVVSNQEAFARDLRNRYDVLVLYDMSRELDQNGRDNLRQFVESGKGVVVLHHAILNYGDWPWWYRDVVGGRYLDFADLDLPPSTYQHDVDMNVRVVTKHPVTAGLDAFQIYDETYKGMWISPEITVLLETDHPTSDGPVAWIGPNRQSRVVYIQLGHGEEAHRNPNYRRLVQNAILWTGDRLP